MGQDRENFSDFIIFFQRQKKNKKKDEIFYTVVMCSLLIFLCICRLYIIVTKNKRNNNYYYYCYMVLYEKYIWKNIKALFFQLSYLSLREIRKYTNFPIGLCYGCYPQIVYLWVPIVTYNYIYGVSWTMLNNKHSRMQSFKTKK